MDLFLEMEGSNIVLLMLRREKYHQDIIGALLAAEKKVTRCCYICVNDPYSFVNSNLRKNAISPEKFFFIDTITKKVQSPPPAADCIFVSAPNAFTEISLAFSKAFSENHCDGTFFDSISALMIYENTHSIIQFVHSILTKIRISNGKAFFIALEDDSSSELVKDLHMFVDKVISIK